jgi:hypothetical protein
LNQSILITTLISTLCLISNSVIAAGGHGEKVGGKKGGGSKSCNTTAIYKIKPEHLASVSPQTEISFWVKGIKDASKVEVIAKKMPVAVTAEDKEHFFSFKGKLPESLRGTAARIYVKVHSNRFPAEKGWLLKISA